MYTFALQHLVYYNISIVFHTNVIVFSVIYFQSPMDKTRLVFPHVPACILAIIIYALYWLLAPMAVMHAVFAGTILGYLCYDLTHYYLHHGNPSSTYFKDLKTYHVKHHFKSQDQGRFVFQVKDLKYISVNL